VSSNTDHRKIYETVLKAAIELVDGTCGSLQMIDERGELRFVSSVGLDSALAGLAQRKGRGMAGWVAEKREPLLLVAGREQDERLKDPVAQRAEGNIAISVPLVAHADLIGVLNVGCSDVAAMAKFDEYDLRYTHLFAHHASIAIENADLLETKRALAKQTPVRV
jgi:GAF domain-containing protein